MSKYIDAEKLAKAIEEKGFDCSFTLKVERLDILALIDELQQEQSLPCWIHANYSDKPEVRYTPSGVPYLQNGAHMIWLSDLEMLPKDGTDLTNLMQEQPEVDLEKEMDKYYGMYRDNNGKTYDKEIEL